MIIPLLLGLSLGASSLVGQTRPPPPAPTPGSELRVWLVTMGAGEAVWERFGHNALRVLDTSTGEDVAYNWGIFDFDQVDFIPRFLRGEMLYMAAAFPTEPMVEAYARTGRHIVMQELALTPAQRLAVRNLAERNVLPENREYFYDYFLDNCSTRVRDLLDRVLDGALAQRFRDAPTVTSFRYHIRRLTGSDPLLFTGMDVLLGTPGDRPISVWEEMFLPMALHDGLRDMTVVDDTGAEGPMVLAEHVVVQGTAPGDPNNVPSRFALYLLLGLVIGGVLAWSCAESDRSTRWKRSLFLTLGTLWSVVAGVVGTILVLVLFTDHRFMFWNANLFLLTPLSLALAVLVPLGVLRPGARPATERLALAVAGIAVAGVAFQLLPAFRQQNAIFVALTLPIHVGLWYSLKRWAREAPVPGSSPR